MKKTKTNKKQSIKSVAANNTKNKKPKAKVKKAEAKVYNINETSYAKTEPASYTTYQGITLSSNEDIKTLNIEAPEQLNISSLNTEQPDEYKDLPEYSTANEENKKEKLYIVSIAAVSLIVIIALFCL